MSIGEFPQHLPAPPTPVAAPARADVLVSEGIHVPGWVVDLASYRRWAVSEGYPRSGWVSYLDGIIFVDTNKEELFTHNLVKGAYAFAIMSALGPSPRGVFVHDRMLLSNVFANLCTEPDGLFFFWTTVQSGPLSLREGAHGFIELSGTPDMVLEVVSHYSVRKDTVKLRELYHRAGVAEYWLVDARGAEPRYDILGHTEKEYVAVEPVEGWLPSSVLQRKFQLVKQTNPLGQPQFIVNQKELA